jgi:biopolymer transport protein ExbB
MKFFQSITRLLSIGALTCGSLSAQNLTTIQQSQQAKLQDAIQRLNTQRAAIQQEQIPLAKELSQLELKAKTLRLRLDEVRRVRDSRSVDLETLQKTVAEQQKEYDYITRALFSEYNSDYESSLSMGELDSYGESVRALNLMLEHPETTESERLESSLALLRESAERIASTIGGKRYAGKALNQDGIVVDGQFLQLGPLLYFSEQTGDQAGIVEESNDLQSRIQFIDSDATVAIQTLAQTGSGDLPIDLSLGNALALQGTRDSLLQHLKKGGIWVCPIVVFALIATLVALFKFVQIMTIRKPSSTMIHDIVKLLRDDKQAEALTLAEAQPEPARDMLVQAVIHSDESLELVEESMYESMLSTQPKLEKYLNVIAVTASVAPLLGLLGTVTGIIKTFNLMRVFGAGDPKPLISGISEALITTELGLVLAIPALVIHAILSRKVAGVMAHTEKLSVAFINGLSRRSK